MTKLQALEKKTGLPELDAVYREIYEMNTEEGSESRAVAVRAFKWILSAYEPLELSELSYAAALRDNGVPDHEVNNDFVLDVCSNFVTIDASDHAQFAHASVRDFLEDLKIDDSRVYSERTVHTQAAKTCLIYLTSSMFLSAPENVLDTGFPAYVRRFWARHCDTCEKNREKDNVLRKLLLDFLSLEKVHPGFLRWHNRVTLRFSSEYLRWYEQRHSAYSLATYEQRHREYSLARFKLWDGKYKKRNMEEECLTPEPSPFLVACVIGVLDVVVKHRTEEQAMLNAQNSWSHSVLHLACIFGHLDVALMLLERGASANTRDIGGRTPLNFAVNAKSEALVRMLLEAGADVESKDDLGLSPLHSAVNTENEALVRILLEAGADVESKNNMGLSPLFSAVTKGSIPLVRILLDFGANSNIHVVMNGNRFAAAIDFHRLRKLLRGALRRARFNKAS